jgi:hypothetical protein
MKKIFTLCLISSFLLTGAALALTIEDIQKTTDPGGAPPDTCYPSPYLDSTVTITATVVAVKQGNYDNYHLQDADASWDGIYVFSTEGDPVVGDNVTITGTVSEYYGLTEITDVTEYIFNSAGNAFDTCDRVNCNTIRLSCDYLSEPWEGQLVKIDEPTVDSAGSYGQYYISDYTGETAIIDDEFYKYGGSQPTIVVGETYQHIMGVVHYSYGQYLIYPRYADDVMALEDPPPSVDRAFAIPGPQEGSPIAHGMQVWFSEAVDEVTAEDPSNYTIVGGEFTILTATWIDDEDSNKVELTTTDQPDEQIVTLKVIGVEDLNGNAIPPEDPEYFDFLCGYTDIYDIQTAVNGDTTQYYGYYATVRGRCSATPGTWHWSNFYVTDESGEGTKDGVLCYTGDILGAQDTTLGALVVLAGICGEYYNETEMVEVAWIAWYDSLCPPPDIFPCPPVCNWPYYTYHTAAEISNSNPTSAELYEATLCKVTNLEVVEVGSSTYKCVDLLGDTVIVGFEGNATYDPTVGDFVSGIGGILRYRYEEYRLTPRDDGDLDFNETAMLDVKHPACIQIQSEGGSFRYSFHITNNTNGQVTGDFWAMATLPGGGNYGPIQIYENKTVQPYQTLSSSRGQNVPAMGPSGVYVYRLYIGGRPGVKMDSTLFMVEKLGADAADAVCTNWDNYQIGEEFASSAFYRPDFSGEEQLPVSFALYQNYPNPFNAKTSIQYAMPSKGEVKLEVYNLLGRKVTTLVDGEKEAGYYSVTWDASTISSGIYFYRLTSGDYTAVKRLTLLK